MFRHCPERVSHGRACCRTRDLLSSASGAVHRGLKDPEKVRCREASDPAPRVALRSSALFRRTAATVLAPALAPGRALERGWRLRSGGERPACGAGRPGQQALAVRSQLRETRRAGGAHAGADQSGQRALAHRRRSLQVGARQSRPAGRPPPRGAHRQVRGRPVTPDFDGELEALERALSGVDVLSVSAVPEYVSRGVVLGFELVSGKPKILLDLPRAKRQNVDFSASVLRLMKVYR